MDAEIVQKVKDALHPIEAFVEHDAVLWHIERYKETTELFSFQTIDDALYEAHMVMFLSRYMRILEGETLPSIHLWPVNAQVNEFADNFREALGLNP